jgi:TolB-like protein
MRRIRSFGLGLFLFLSGSGLPAQGIGMTLSVLYFDNTSGNAEYAWLSKGLADMIASDLASAPGATLVEREELEKVLKEMELGMSGITDSGGAPKLGKILNAEVLVYGGYVISGGKLRLDAKAVKAGTGAVIASARAEGEAADALAAQRALSGRLASGLGLSIREPEAVKSEAARTYYEGLSLFDEGRYAEALSLFSQARAQDPGFLKPGKSIEEAYKYLKDFKRQRFRREMNALATDIEGLTERIGGPVFYSFADMAANPGKFGFKDAAAASAEYQAHPRSYAGSTPVQAIWELQNLYSELADMAMEYFEESETKRYCQDMMLAWADAAEKNFPKDPFLPETLYQKIFVYRDREEWRAMRDLCERLMGDYPDYRMMWAVEDFYETALEKLKG